MDRWRATLDLAFSQRGNETWLDKQAHTGPLRVQRAFYPEGPRTPHVYLLHPPGGVVEGDHLSIRCEARTRSSGLVTTPGATKFYRGKDYSGVRPEEPAPAEQVQSLKVCQDATLEWFPQESIAFDGARASLTTEIHLEEGARLAAWDILCLGRPGSGETFSTGVVRQQLEVRRRDKPILLERSAFAGSEPIMTKRWGLGGKPVSGTFLIVSPELSGGETRRSGGHEDELLGRVVAAMSEAQSSPSADRVPGADAVPRADAGRHAEEEISASWLRGCIICRYLGGSTERAKQVFTAAWTVLRPSLFARPACPPRIWKT